ncbi:eCIS core domain-containing protein [Halomicrobium katesii]|uniref:eCIS core domain-containing protein n=1 Tax=Halomicrobium katesii TaxID=437163 RepID=UPI0003789020|nr:DUF4157 domain-containing protein [Halomicrobium katesii]
MAGKKANRKRRSNRRRDDDQTTTQRREGRSTTRQQDAAARENPMLAPAVLSPERGDIVPTKPFEQRNQETHDRNIQRAMQDTATSQDEVPEQVLDVVGSGGMPLERSVQDSLEDRMDADFSDVRIHTGAKAAEAADAIDAKAFTCGNSIVFNSGEYDPSSPEGQFLLAHELAHVEQQNGGAPLSMMPQEGPELEIDPDPQLERDADQAAEEALQGEEPLTVNRLDTDVHVQRFAKYEALETLAMLEVENEEESDQISDFREGQNDNRITYLRSVLNEYNPDFQDIGDEDGDIGDISERLQLKELDEELAEKLDDVALTDDQRQKLEQGIDTGEWVDYGTTGAETVIGSLLHPLAGLATGLGIAVLENRFGKLDGDIEERFEKLTKELEEESYLYGEGDSTGDELGK